MNVAKTCANDKFHIVYLHSFCFTLRSRFILVAVPLFPLTLSSLLLSLFHFYFSLPVLFTFPSCTLTRISSILPSPRGGPSLILRHWAISHRPGARASVYALANDGWIRTGCSCRGGVGRKRLGSDYVRRWGGGRGVRSSRVLVDSRPE